MTGDSIDYNELLSRYKYNETQAANDLERYLLRGELPSPGSVARAIVTLHEETRPLIHAHWEDCAGSELDFFGDPVIVPKKRCSHCKETNKNYTPPYCPHCGAVMDEEVPHGAD